MNYYDEEISINSGDIKPTNNVRVERISSRGSNSERGNPIASGRSNLRQAGISMVNNRAGQRTMVNEIFYNNNFTKF